MARKGLVMDVGATWAKGSIGQYRMDPGKPGKQALRLFFLQDFSASEGWAKQVGTAIS